MTEDLYPYQRVGALWLRDSHRAYLGDDPGLGKTRTALAAAVAQGARTIAVACPAIVRDHWRSEAEQAGFGGLLTVESYQKVVLDPEARKPFRTAEVVIAYEAHFLKRLSSKRTQLFLGKDKGLLTQRPDNATWLLSGTPMPRNPFELWPVLTSLWPERLREFNVGGRTSHFLNRYCGWKATRFGIRVLYAKNIPELRELLRPILLRRKTADVLPDLPKLRWTVLRLSAEDVATAALRQLERELTPSQVEALEAGELPPLDANMARYLHAVGDLKAALVGELVADELDADPKAKRVVFAHHLSVLDILQKALEPFGVARVDGSTPDHMRAWHVEQFRHNDATRAFLGQIHACGTGLDGLQYGSNEAVMVEPIWASNVNTQAGHRISRIGQHLPAQVRMIALAQTLDDTIVRNHWRESRMVADVTG